MMCADWRLHQNGVKLNKRLAHLLGVDGVDTIAVPGPDGLALPARAAEWQTAVSQVSLLIGAHSPTALAVAAHQRCAGHPVDNDQHRVDVLKVAKALKDATKFPGPVAAIVVVYRSDTRWSLEKVGEV